MSVFPSLELGAPIPDRTHAVSCSLPTMGAVRGYEEKDPQVVSRLETGYPRFVLHPLARKLADHFRQELALGTETLWLTSSEKMAQGMVAWLKDESLARQQVIHGIHTVIHDNHPAFNGKAKAYLQNIGGFLSSREAEDKLVELGLITKPLPEPTFPGDAAAEIRRFLKPALPAASDHDIVITPSGMNAVYSAFKAVADLQAARGRTIWIQLGWLYLDTIALLKKYTSSPADYLFVSDPLALPKLEALFAAKGAKIAGIITEVPTNPLIETGDLEAIFQLCRSSGARLVVDPSVGSLFSVNVLPYCDVLVASLTKYTASDGDVIAGAVVVNPAGPDADAIRHAATGLAEPVYPRDLHRLAEEITRTAPVLARISETAPKVAAFLSAHPKVDQVYWAFHPRSRQNYLKIARTPTSTGGMISFTLKGDMETFYDRLTLPKGPSFGMTTTLICPFMYLAHYDLVTTAEGRKELAECGLNPDLLRLCVGTEPAEAIIAAIAEALA
jgi:cystathionine gamma-synthase